MDPDFFETPDAKTTPVADLLRRIAVELRDLTQTVDDLQLAVGGLVSSSAAHDACAMHQLQNFDALSQTLSGLADFTQALGDAASEHWRLNPHPASRVVLLSDLAVRLVSNEPAPAAEASAAGEFEFF
jgi:hypothetical protein